MAASAVAGSLTIGNIARAAGDSTTQTAESETVLVESSNPLSANPEAITSGKKLYIRWCQQCHGKALDGYSPRWGQHGADLRRYWRGYDEFVAIVAGGRAEKMMPPFGQYLNIDEVNAIGAFIETKAIEGANWK